MENDILSQGSQGNESSTRKRKSSLQSNQDETKRLKRESGVCTAHKKAKKGCCSVCGACRLCDPSSNCSGQGNHINWKRKFKSMCPQAKYLKTHINKLPNEEESPRVHPRSNHPSTSKNKMSEISSILGIQNKTFLDDFPKKGFTPNSIDKKGRSFGRAKQAYKRVSDGIKSIICPSDPSLLENMGSSKSEECHQKSFRKIISNLVQLSFFGNRNTRTLAQCLMASSLTRNDCVKYLREEYETLEEATRSRVSPKSRLMGSSKFTSLHKTFESLLSGEGIPKQDYSSRIDSSRIAHAISFIQEKEQPLNKPLRDIQVSGYLFKHIPQYDRSKKSIDVQHEEFCSSVNDEHRVGRQTFRDVVMAMTKTSEGRCEASPFFLRFKHIGNVFLRLCRRANELTPISQLSQVESSWERIRGFLMWDYGGSRHLRHSDLDSLHCVQFGLGEETCGHVHAPNPCNPCSEAHSFFCHQVKGALSCVLELSSPEDRPEISNMINEALPRMQTGLTQYMAYRLRTFNRFNAVNRAKIELARKAHGTKVLILMDHMEKVLPHDSKAENTSANNKGICIIGTLEVQYGPLGFTSRHNDYVFKDYYAMDNVTVAAVIDMISRNIRARHPSAKEIIFISDSASCFSEQELIPYIFNLNDAVWDEEGNEYPLIEKWIFTEARPGVSELAGHFRLLKEAFQKTQNEGCMSDEKELFKALSSYEGLRGTSMFLLDGSHLNGPILNTKFKVRGISASDMREVRWGKDSVEVIGAYGARQRSENISSNHLYKHKNSLIITTVELQFSTPDGFIPYIREEIEISPSKEESRRGKHLTDPSNSSLSSSIPIKGIQPGWAREEPSFTSSQHLECLNKLRELSVRSKEARGKRIPPEEALRIIAESVIPGDWGAQVDLSLEDVKAFLGLSLSKMTAIIERGGYPESGFLEEEKDRSEDDEDECSEDDT